MADALILAGGVAKGAFVAGVLSVLLGPEGKRAAPTDVHSVLAASSGALNGAFVAAALHAGTEEEEVGQLTSLWLDDASFGRVFDPSFGGIFGLRGASGEEKVLDLLRRVIKPASGMRTIELRLVVASLVGKLTDVGGAPATTFERVLTFDGATFESTERLEAMFRAVTASAAFPGAFLPVPLEIDGVMTDCIDGGAVNNTPLGHALEHPVGIERVIVVTPQPRISAVQPSDLRGMGLVLHLAEMLIEERLFRDLRRAFDVNRALTELERIVEDPALRGDVLESIGWAGRKPVTIVEIRPDAELPGKVFDGFFSRDLREGYVRSGEDAARAWLSRSR